MKAMAITHDGVPQLGVMEVEIKTESGTDGLRLLNIGGHHSWLASRQMTYLEEI
jgi:hypothetical protein